MKKTIVIGDIHGAGQELVALLSNFEYEIAEDHYGHIDFVFLGDLFDRARHGHLVWDTIQKYKVKCLMGNHERKMLSFLKGQRDTVPPHYYWAIKNLNDHGVSKDALVGFLEGLPTILVSRQDVNRMGGRVVLSGQSTLLPSDIILVHAGVNVENVLDPDPSYTVYGKFKPKEMHDWWDVYNGENLVVYGHLAAEDGYPRLRHRGDRAVSIGIDTGACHGGSLTAYCLETGSFISYRSGIDWAWGLKDELQAKR
jgi:serine/threonine protein phosphatase 1